MGRRKAVIHADTWMMALDHPLPLGLAFRNHFFLLCGNLTPLGAGPDFWAPPIITAPL